MRAYRKADKFQPKIPFSHLIDVSASALVSMPLQIAPGSPPGKVTRKKALIKLTHYLSLPLY